MEFKLGKAILRTREGFKPKSLTSFIETYSYLGSKEELTKVFNKLNGNVTGTKRKSKKA